MITFQMNNHLENVVGGFSVFFKYKTPFDTSITDTNFIFMEKFLFIPI